MSEGLGGESPEGLGGLFQTFPLFQIISIKNKESHEGGSARNWAPPKRAYLAWLPMTLPGKSNFFFGYVPFFWGGAI